MGAAQLQRKQDSLPAFTKALALLPQDAESHFNLATALKIQGELAAAAQSYRAALAIQPDYEAALANLGNTLRQLGNHHEAVETLRQALDLRPDSAEAHNNLGAALKDSGQLDRAVAHYRQAIALSPTFLNAHYNLANTLKDLGQLDAAIIAYRQTLKLQPNFAEAHSNLGVALQQNNQLTAAMASYRHALQANPNHLESYNNLGAALKQAGQFEQAADNYRHLLAIKPDFAEAWSNLGASLKELGQIEESIACHRRALEIRPDFAEAHDTILYTLNIAENTSIEHRLDEARRYGRMVARKVKQHFTRWLCPLRPERLRVGLVSGDLRTHAVGFFVDDLLAQIDPSRIELFAYPTCPETDELTERIKPHFAAWHPLYGLNDEAAATRIHADGIHLLIDLSGHTAGNRLPVFAWKPAPVQASWLGYFATTGVAEIDYLLADKVSVTGAQLGQFTESIWHLPDTKQCLTAPNLDLKVAPSPAVANGYPTFGSFQRLDKIGDRVLAVWAEILSALPEARLRLATKLLGNASSREQFASRLRQHHVDLSRVSMGGGIAGRADYLAQYHKVDIMLDTFPYAGTTTTCEALWMGVPTVTLAGETFLSRFGASVVAAAGMNEWVASSEADYIAKAIQYTRQPDYLAKLRSELREQVLASPVFDVPRFARNFEAALWGMWQQRQPRDNK